MSGIQAKQDYKRFHKIIQLNRFGNGPAKLSITFLAVAFYAFVRSRIFQISLEAVIGISYAIAAAAALFLVGIAPGGHMHIQNILSGSLLWVGWPQIITSLIVFSVIGCSFYLIRKAMAEISNAYRKNSTKGLSVVF